MKKGATASDRIAIAMLTLSLMMLAYAYGVATMKYEIFPHSLLSHAQKALDALRKVEKEDLPPHFIRYVRPDEADRIVQAERGGHNSDLIFMTGGFYYRTDICPKVGCLAWIMSRDGKILHSWSHDPDTLFEPHDFDGFDGSKSAQNIFVQGADLDLDGNLVVTFQTRNIFPYHFGIAKFGRDGRLLWKRINHSHHWPTVGADGRIYAPSARIVRLGDRIAGMPQKPECKFGAIYQEGVRVLSPAGDTLAEFWMDEVVRASDRKALAYTVRDDCDPFHVNGIELVNAAGARKLQAIGVVDAKPGDLAVSLRSTSSLVFMDGVTGHIKHIAYGPMVDQHSPASLPDGDMLLFDNLGASTGQDSAGDGSRILKVSLASENYQQVFPQTGGDRFAFFSPAEGVVNVSADGTRALACETHAGRVIEVDLKTGTPLWIYREVDSISAYRARVGADPTTKLGLLKTQGASYVTQEDFHRIFR